MSDAEKQRAAEWDAWLSSRPDCVKELARKFMPCDRVYFPDGRCMYVIGYHEDGGDEAGLLLTPVKPEPDVSNYDEMVAARERLCAHDTSHLVTRVK